jgi:heme exporter protein D
MQWASWHDFWAMGGSGAFVWGAYGMAALVLLGEVVMVRARMRRAREYVLRTAPWTKEQQP